MDIKGINCTLTERRTDSMYIVTLQAIDQEISGSGDTVEEARERAVEGMKNFIDGHKVIEKDGTRFVMKYFEEDSNMFENYHHVKAFNGDTGNMGVGKDPDPDYAEYQAIRMSQA